MRQTQSACDNVEEKKLRKKEINNATRLKPKEKRKKDKRRPLPSLGFNLGPFYALGAAAAAAVAAVSAAFSVVAAAAVVVVVAAAVATGAAAAG